MVLILTFSTLNASAKWTQPIIEDNPNITGHIFKKSPGHFDKNIPENRSFIEYATSSSSFKISENRHGVEIYLKTTSRGEQAWAYVRNGKIVDGGRNNFPKQWVADDPKNGGRFITPKFIQYRADSQTFKGHLVINNIKSVYEAACQTPQYTALQIRKIQGVAGKYGKILNLLDSPEQEGSHTFYIPTYELSETEALQTLRDVARGVYVY